MPQNILIIGAGIIGSALAYRLSQTNCSVTVLDPSRSGGTASAASFGWTNAAYENPRPYFDLRLYAMTRWDALKAALPALPYVRNGTLYTDFYGIPLQTLFEEHRPWGYPLDWVEDWEIQAMEPNLATPPDRALFCPIEGQILCDRAAQLLLKAAIANGVIHIPEAAQALTSNSHCITGAQTASQTLTADTTLIACGAHSNALTRTVGIHTPMETPKGLLIHTKPAPNLIRHTILTDGLHMQQRPDGTITAGGDFGGGSINDDPETGSKTLMARLHSALKSNHPLVFSHYTLGERPTPQDGLPIIGRLAPGLYITAMHSGATLAAGVAELAAKELTTGQRDPLLTPFHPNRFQQSNSTQGYP